MSPEEDEMRSELWYLNRDGEPSRRIAAGEILPASARLATVEVDDAGNPIRIIKTF